MSVETHNQIVKIFGSRSDAFTLENLLKEHGSEKVLHSLFFLLQEDKQVADDLFKIIAKMKVKRYSAIQ